MSLVVSKEEIEVRTADGRVWGGLGSISLISTVTVEESGRTIPSHYMMVTIPEPTLINGTITVRHLAGGLVVIALLLSVAAATLLFLYMGGWQ